LKIYRFAPAGRQKRESFILQIELANLSMSAYNPRNLLSDRFTNKDASHDQVLQGFILVPAIRDGGRRGGG